MHELRSGLPYRTVPPLPPGYSIDWADPKATQGFNAETGDLTLLKGVFGGPGLGFDTLTVTVEVLPPNAEVLPPNAEVLPPTTTDSAAWARATTRRLLDEEKIPEGVKQAGLARLLAAEAQRAVKAGQLGRTLEASYIENQLKAWGIWPLSSLEMS